MAKKIKLTNKDLDALIDKFAEECRKMLVFDGSIKFSTTVSNVETKAEVVITALAWAKMRGLVDHFSKEVGWHCCASRGDDGKYYVTDVIVYPQTVTGAKVDMDEIEYAKWEYEHRNDPRIDHLFAHGHSHVNMGVSPSTVDLNHYEEILKRLKPDSFYVFFILNKKNEKTCMVYDMQKNLFFDTADCVVTVLDPPVPKGAAVKGVSKEEARMALQYISSLRIAAEVDAFIKESEPLVVEKKYDPPYYGKGKVKTTGVDNLTTKFERVSKTYPYWDEEDDDPVLSAFYYGMR